MSASPLSDALRPGLNRDAAEFLFRAGLTRNPCAWPRFRVRVNRAGSYFALFFVYQICGTPLTPDFSIALFNSGEAANALACSRLWKS